jgi:lysophospholipase L1-like esterase
MVKIVALGDSITWGFPFTPEQSWVHLVAQQTGHSVYNKGICGDTTGDMRRRFRRDVLALEPDAVIITGGSNDAFMAAATEEVGENIAEMIKLAGQHGITPAVGLPPQLDYPVEEALLAQYRMALRSFAASKGIFIIDFYSGITTAAKPGRSLNVDGVHPGVEGYQAMAAAALSFLGHLENNSK